MALQSKLFQGDPKLEACLIQDLAHIMLGAVGDHVTKMRIPAMLNGDSGHRERRFRTSRSLIGAKRRRWSVW